MKVCADCPDPAVCKKAGKCLKAGARKPMKKGGYAGKTTKKPMARKAMMKGGRAGKKCG